MDRISSEPASSDRLQSLGAFIRTHRKELGLTQAQLAERLGWTQERVSVLENGRYGMPSLHALASLATALELGLADVVDAAGYPLERSKMVRATGGALPEANALLLTLHQLLGIRATSLRDALTEAATILAELMATDKIDAFILEPETQTLVALGVSTTPMALRQRELGLDRIQLAHGTREAQVFHSGEPYSTPDAGKDPGILPGVSETLGVQSMMIVPLDVAGKRQGVLTANSSRPGSFSPGDLAFMQTVGRWVGMVAEQAELSETVAREAAQSARHTTAEELVQVLAHDLNNLVPPVLAPLDLIRGEAEREGQETYLIHAAAATTSVRRIERLVRDLLDATHLEHGLSALAAQPVDLSLLTQEVAALFESEETPIEVRSAVQIEVTGDPERLRQVLENIISNAVAHSPPGLPVVVEISTETRDDGRWVVVDVRDQGPGISPELMPTLFQRFSPGPDSSGLGLDLYLARGIAEAHGGTLALDPASETGTTMRLALPIRES